MSAAKPKASVGKRAYASQRRVGDCDLLEQGAFTGSKKPLPLVRLREIEALIRYRCGPGGCVTDDADLFLFVGLNHLARYYRTVVPKKSRWEPFASVARTWVARWLPAVPPDIVADAIRRVEARPRKYTAETLGRLLRLNRNERVALDIRTFRAADQTEEERRQEARDRKTAKQRERRAEKRKSRPKSREEERPWEDERMSRSAWYARRAKAKADGRTKSDVHIGRDFPICGTQIVQPPVETAVVKVGVGTRALGARVHRAVEPLRGMAAALGKLAGETRRRRYDAA